MPRTTTTVTTPAASSSSDAIVPESLGSSSKRKRKAEIQGVRKCEDTRLHVVERSIEQLVWEDLWSDDFSTVEKATKTLAELTKRIHPESTINCERVLKASGNTIMLKNIEKSLAVNGRSSFIVQTLLVMKQLCEQNSVFSDRLAETPMIVETLIKFLGEYSDKVDCYSAVCFLLEQLSTSDHNDNFRIKILKQGAIPLIVECIERFDDQLAGFSLLTELLHSYEEKKKIARAACAANALSILARAKEKSPKNEAIQDYTRACIRILNEY